MIYFYSYMWHTEKGTQSVRKYSVRGNGWTLWNHRKVRRKKYTWPITTVCDVKWQLYFLCYFHLPLTTYFFLATFSLHHSSLKCYLNKYVKPFSHRFIFNWRILLYQVKKAVYTWQVWIKRLPRLKAGPDRAPSKVCIISIIMILAYRLYSKNPYVVWVSQPGVAS